MRLNLSPGMIFVPDSLVGWRLVHNNNLGNGADNYLEVMSVLDGSFVAYNASASTLETYDISAAHVITLSRTQFVGITSSSPDIVNLSATQVAVFSAAQQSLSTFDWDGTDWTSTGNTLTSLPYGGSFSVRVSALSATEVVMLSCNSTTSSYLETYGWDGTNWTQTGNTLTFPTTTGRATDVTAESATLAHVVEPNFLRAFTWDGTNWTDTGNEIELGYKISNASNSTSFELISSTQICEWDAISRAINIFDWTGTEWVLTSNKSELFGGSQSGPRMALIDGPTVAAVFNRAINSIRRFQFDGTNWAHGGSPLLIIGNDGDTDICAIDTNTIAAIRQTSGTIQAYFYNGANWAPLGNAYSLGYTLADSSIDQLATNSVVVLADDGTQTLERLDFDGTNWVRIGNPSAGPETVHDFVTALSSTRVVASSTRLSGPTVVRGLTTYDFDGTNWAIVGNPHGANITEITSSIGFSGYVQKLTATSIVGYSDAAYEKKITTFDFDGTNWTRGGESEYLGERSEPRIDMVQGNIVALTDINANAVETYEYVSPAYTRKATPSSSIEEVVDITSMGTGRVGLVSELTTGAIEVWDIDALGIPTQLPGTFNTGTASSLALTSLSATEIVMLDDDNDMVNNDFDGLNVSTFAANGNSFPMPGLVDPVGVMLSATRMVVANLADATRFVTFDLVGLDWVEIGNRFQYRGTVAAFVDICRLSNNRIAIVESSTDELSVYDFDGTDWAEVGTSFDFGNIIFADITAMSSSRVAIIEGTGDSLRMYDFNGATWSQVGTTFDLPGTVVNRASVLSLSATELVVSNPSTSGGSALLAIYDFDGTNWTLVEDLAAHIQGYTNDKHNLLRLGAGRFISMETLQEPIFVYSNY